jgi:predicted RNA-binding protein YlqC (UPF0109 family)
MTNITDTLDYLIKAIVTDSSSIVIDSRDENGVLILEVSAAAEIIGQIIGKEGKIIKSLRTILNLSFPDVRYSLEVKG